MTLDADIGSFGAKGYRTPNPDVVQRLMQYVERARADLGDSLLNVKGKNVRPAGN
jgi:hypothetical protein